VRLWPAGRWGRRDSARRRPRARLRWAHRCLARQRTMGHAAAPTHPPTRRRDPPAESRCASVDAWTCRSPYTKKVGRTTPPLIRGKTQHSGSCAGGRLRGPRAVVAYRTSPERRGHLPGSTPPLNRRPLQPGVKPGVPRWSGRVLRTRGGSPSPRDGPAGRRASEGFGLRYGVGPSERTTLRAGRAIPQPPLRSGWVLPPSTPTRAPRVATAPRGASLCACWP